MFSLLNSWALPQTVLFFHLWLSLICAETFWGDFSEPDWRLHSCAVPELGLGHLVATEAGRAALHCLSCGVGILGKTTKSINYALLLRSHRWALPWFLLTWGWQGSAHSCYPSFLLLLRSYRTGKTGVCWGKFEHKCSFKSLIVIPFLCNMYYSLFWGWVSSSLLSIRRHTESCFLLASSLIPFKTMSSDGLDLPRAII